MESQNRVRCSSSSSSRAYLHETHQDQFSFFPSYSSPYAVASLTSNAEKIPHGSSSWYPSSDGNGYGDAASLKSDQQSFLQNDWAKSADQDLDSLDCDSEEGMEASEEPPKLAMARSSSSKRNRTAEVHNLSEKRRRSRINEKMKALQRLIPNSSKTDKASMLDEAIEYLKQLQLQVQMLSMRNALSRHPKYMSGGVLQPLQALQMGIDFGLNNERSMNTQVELLPQNQNHGSSSVPNSFHLSNPPSASMPSIISISEPVTSFAMESAQHHHASFPLPVSFEEILTGNMMQHQHPDARHSSINSQRK